MDGESVNIILDNDEAFKLYCELKKVFENRTPVTSPAPAPTTGSPTQQRAILELERIIKEKNEEAERKRKAEEKGRFPYGWPLDSFPPSTWAPAPSVVPSPAMPPYKPSTIVPDFWCSGKKVGEVLCSFNPNITGAAQVDYTKAAGHKLTFSSDPTDNQGQEFK